MSRLNSADFKIFDLGIFLGKNHENHGNLSLIRVIPGIFLWKISPQNSSSIIKFIYRVILGSTEKYPESPELWSLLKIQFRAKMPRIGNLKICSLFIVRNFLKFISWPKILIINMSVSQTIMVNDFDWAWVEFRV